MRGLQTRGMTKEPAAGVPRAHAAFVDGVFFGRIQAGTEEAGVPNDRPDQPETWFCLKNFGKARLLTG